MCMNGFVVEGFLQRQLTVRNVGNPVHFQKEVAKGFTFRCSGNKNHEFTMFKYSFFDKGQTDCRDVIQFVKSYLENSSLKLCSSQAGVHYGSTAVRWGSFIREVFVDSYERKVKDLKFTGEIEIDESLFGRQWKHHRGHQKGMSTS